MVESTNNKEDNANVEEIKYIPSTTDKEIKELKPENGTKSDTLFLYFTVITAFLVILSGTAVMVWTSPGISKLKSNDTDVNPLGRPITTIEISMILGIPLSAAIPFMVVFPKLSDSIGRKKTIHLAGLGIFMSIISLAYCTNVILIILFLTLAITLYGAGFTIFPTYLSEICEDHNRAKFGCLMSVFFPLGNLYGFIIGSTLNFRNFTLILAAPLISFLIFFFVTPETPVYLLSKKRTEECRSALKKLRSNKNDQEIEEDLNNIHRSLEVRQRQTTNTLFNILNTKEGRTGFILATIPLIVRMASGVLIVISLIAPIFNEADTNIPGDTVAILTGIVTIFSAMFPYFFVDKIGKKRLLLITTIGTGVSASILGMFYFLKHINSPVVEQMQLLPVFCILLYIIFYYAGLGPIPLAIAAELFLPKDRSAAVGFGYTLSSVVFSILSFSYPLAAEAFGTHYCLWTFGVCCFVGAGIFHFKLPETDGKNVLEIQEILRKY